MKNQNRRLVVLALTLAGLWMGGALMAEENAQSNAPKAWGPDARVEHMTKALDLSQDQQAQIKKILDDQAAQMKEMREKTDAQIQGVLNDDQKKKYAEMKDKMKEKLQERREKRMQKREQSESGDDKSR